MSIINYKYCLDENFDDFASGKVIFSKSGFTNFPVRLAQEIFCRCLSYLEPNKNICLYDPCGGCGYLLTTLGFLNQNIIRTIVYSDISEEALDIAKQNLSLLTNEGIEKRINQLETFYKQFGKESHLQAIESANKLSSLISTHNINPDTLIFKADILQEQALVNKSFKADIVFADVPYGNLVSWKGNEVIPINTLLNNLIPVLNSTSVVAICSDKQQKIQNNAFMRLEKQQIGKRKFELLRINPKFRGDHD